MFDVSIGALRTNVRRPSRPDFAASDRSRRMRSSRSVPSRRRQPGTRVGGHPGTTAAAGAAIAKRLLGGFLSEVEVARGSRSGWRAPGPTSPGRPDRGSLPIPLRWPDLDRATGPRCRDLGGNLDGRVEVVGLEHEPSRRWLPSSRRTDRRSLWSCRPPHARWSRSRAGPAAVPG